MFDLEHPQQNWAAGIWDALPALQGEFIRTLESGRTAAWIASNAAAEAQPISQSAHMASWKMFC